MTRKVGGSGRARLRLAAVLTALPLGATVVGGVAYATPVAAASTAKAAIVATSPASTVARHGHDDKDHRHDDGRCHDRGLGGLLGLLADLLIGERNHCR